MISAIRSLRMDLFLGCLGEKSKYSSPNKPNPRDIIGWEGIDLGNKLLGEFRTATSAEVCTQSEPFFAVHKFGQWLLVSEDAETTVVFDKDYFVGNYKYQNNEWTQPITENCFDPIDGRSRWKGKWADRDNFVPEEFYLFTGIVTKQILLKYAQENSRSTNLCVKNAAERVIEHCNFYESKGKSSYNTIARVSAV